MNPIAKSKNKVQMPDGFYVGRVGGWELMILSQDQFSIKPIPLENGIRGTVFVVVVVKDGIANCFDRGIKI